jgi:TolB-like protein/AraC-like DNA-binding protein/Tfp pilus assembly protein PilF
MDEQLSLEQVFIRKLTDIILSNLKNENFGVEELSREMGMSHTTILRKLKSYTHLSISQFIREVRLQKAHEMLLQNLGTASEISYRVGFGSPTYFSKCFHEYYGYPPGEVRKNESLISNPKVGRPDLLHPELLRSGEEKTTFRGIWNKLSRPRLLITTVILAGMVLAWLLLQTVTGGMDSTAETFSRSDEKSIVVLPFKDLSTESENQYLADGVTIDIRDHLSRVKGLKVISGTTSEHFRDRILPIPELAKELGVSYVLEGSAQTNNDRTRVSVKLIDATHDRQLLSETFDRDLSDIFSVQSEIAQIIAARLKAVLSEEVIEAIEKIPTKSTESHRNYLKGRYFWNLNSNTGILTSIEYYEKSITADPAYASAYAGLAEAYYSMAPRVWIPAEEAPEGWIAYPEAFRKAEEIANKALAIDPNLAEAHAVLGGVYGLRDWQWERAREEFLKSIELNPNYATAYSYYASLLDIFGENEEARRQLNIALELDPLSPSFNYQNMRLYYNQGNFHEALNAWNECVEMGFVSSPYPYYFYIYMHLGEEALSYGAAMQFRDAEILKPELKGMLQQMYQESGTRGILELLNRVNAKKTEPFHLYNLAKRNAILGNIRESLDWLEKAYLAGFVDMPEIYNYYDFRNLRGEPRFNALLRQMNLPEYKPQTRSKNYRIN